MHQIPPAFPSLPAQLSVTFCPCLASNNTHLTLSFSSSSALPPLYCSDFCFILAQTLPLGSPSPPSPVPRISCPYHFALPTSALSHPVPIIFPFQTILCNPQLEIHQSITVLILSPFALPFSPCPTGYDPSIFSFIYIPDTLTLFPNWILFPSKCILTPSCTHKQSHIQDIHPWL